MSGLPPYQWKIKGMKMIRLSVRDLAGPGCEDLDLWNQGMQFAGASAMKIVMFKNDSTKIDIRQNATLPYDKN